MGEAAEQWTAQELRPLERHGWRLVNHVSLDDRGDIDHVLVGPGGVLVLETKWGASPWRLQPPDQMLGPTARSLQRRTKQLELAIHKHLGTIKVLPLLVLWGRASAEITEATTPVLAQHTDVGVLAGMNLRDWALRRSRNGLSEHQVDAIWHELARYAAYTDSREETLPEAISDILFSSAVAVGLGLVSFVGLIEINRLLHGWVAGVLTSGSALAGSLWLRHRLSARPAVRRMLTGVAAGSGMVLLIWLVALAWS